MTLRSIVLMATLASPSLTTAHRLDGRTLLKKYVHTTSEQPQRSMNSVTESILFPAGYTPLSNYQFPIVISSPGYYLFAEDIFFDGTLAAAAIAISPNVGEVTIDFGNFTLNQSVAAAGVSGISVGSGNNRVTIRGGSIKGFSQSGIYVADQCSEIYIDSMSIVNCSNRGIEFIGSGGIIQSAITNCVFTGNCTVSAADQVLTLSNCSDVTVSNCLLNANGITGVTITSTMINVKTVGCNRCFFEKVKCTNSAGNTNARGFSLESTTNSHFEQCVVDAISSSSAVAGFFLENNRNCSNNKFLQCHTNALSGAHTVDGFAAETTANDNLFDSCESAFHSSSNAFGNAHGFRMSSNSRNQLYKCRAHGNSAPSNAAVGAYGFRLESCTDTSLNECRASSHTSAGTSIGISVRNATGTAVFHCVSASNGLGFNHVGTFNSQAYIQNVAFKNSSHYSASFPITAHDDTVGSTPSLLGNPWNNIAIA
jgi:hypothetical protein